MSSRLNRALRDAPPAPVRIVHLGLGNFHRAHQAWYTQHAPDAPQWGIAAFTGRRPDMAQALAPQDGLFTLITRRGQTDEFEVVSSIVAAHTAGEHEAFLDYLRRPEVAIVTITLTEHAYLRDAAGNLDLQRPEVRADLEAHAAGEAPSTLPGRLYAGLLARREAGAGPITLLSCDNLPENGEVLRTILTQFADATGGDLSSWLVEHVDFAQSMVDRITPATTPEDVALVRAEQGYDDQSPVPTEPFSEWVLSGAFPAGRPQWEDAGAQVVADVGPHERRKLWLLNGSHSLLAYTGPLLGHRTIDEAIADPRCRGWVQDLWDSAQRHLGLDESEVQRYREALLERYGNTGVRHQLAQIAADGSQKLAVRIAPIVRAERDAGDVPTAAVTALAGWFLHLRGHGAPVKDPGAGPAQTAAAGTDLSQAVSEVIATVDTELAGDEVLVRAVQDAVLELAELAGIDP